MPSTYCMHMQLTRDLFAIAKFLFFFQVSASEHPYYTDIAVILTLFVVGRLFNFWNKFSISVIEFTSFRSFSKSRDQANLRSTGNKLCISVSENNVCMPFILFIYRQFCLLQLFVLSLSAARTAFLLSWLHLLVHLF